MSATEADLRADSSVPSATPFTKQGGTHHGLAQRRAEHHQQQQQNLQESTSQLSSNDLSHERNICLLYTSPSPRDRTRSRMPSSA